MKIVVAFQTFMKAIFQCGINVSAKISAGSINNKGVRLGLRPSETSIDLFIEVQVFVIYLFNAYLIFL